MLFAFFAARGGEKGRSACGVSQQTGVCELGFGVGLRFTREFSKIKLAADGNNLMIKKFDWFSCWMLFLLVLERLLAAWLSESCCRNAITRD